MHYMPLVVVKVYFYSVVLSYGVSTYIDKFYVLGGPGTGLSPESHCRVYFCDSNWIYGDVRTYRAHLELGVGQLALLYLFKSVPWLSD